MPIKDGSLASHYHTEDVIQCTRRVLARIATSGVRSADPQQSIFAEMADAPRVYLNHHRAAYDLISVPQQRAADYITKLNLTASSNILFVGSSFGWTAEWIKLYVPGINIICTDIGGWVQSTKNQDDAGDVEAAMDDARDPTYKETVVGVQGAMRDTFMSYLNQGVRAKEPIIEEDALSTRSRNKIKQMLGSPATHIFTEHVLEWHWDNEAANLSDALHQLEPTARIIHKINEYQDTAAAKTEPGIGLNWKRVADSTSVIPRLTNQPNYIESDWKAVLPNDEFILTHSEALVT
jgi:hypothetical protein